MNWQLVRYLLGTGLTTFADRSAQVQLLSTVVMSGPDGQGLGSNTLSLLMPFVLLSYALGALADNQDNRKLLIYTTLIRGLLVLSVPTILTLFGATGVIVPSSIFTLSACVAICTILDFALLPRLSDSSKQLRTANAISLFTITAATLAAVSIAPTLSDIWLPHDTLRVAAVLYFVAMCLFWTMDRTKTKILPRAVNQTRELANVFKVRKGSISIFRLGFFTYVGHGIFYCLFLIFCIQNTQLNNAQSSNIFAILAWGFLSGVVASLTLLRRFKTSSLIGYSTALSALACLLFATAGNNYTALRLFLLIMGTTGATTLICINTLLQREFNCNVRGKVYGAILCLATATYTLATVGVEQITTHYAALTIVRVMAAGWLVFVVLVAISSNGLKTRWRKARCERKSRLSGNSAQVTVEK
ncbi:MAG: MFS transporter [Cyanobacteria bacterium SZAS-4]|nr:MFS transporter [Cyanobacteria bacterium SZAS-4]